MKLNIVPFLLFYVEIIIDSQEAVRIVQRGPVYSSSSFPSDYILIIVEYQNQEFDIRIM